MGKTCAVGGDGEVIWAWEQLGSSRRAEQPAGGRFGEERSRQGTAETSRRWGVRPVSGGTSEVADGE